MGTQETEISTLELEGAMKRRIRRYSKEFKLEALRLVVSSDSPVVEIDDELGITLGLLNA